MRLIRCPGCHLYYAHIGESSFRCRGCHDTAYTEVRYGQIWSFNRFGKVVDKKPVTTEPAKPYPNPNTQQYAGYTIYTEGTS